MSVLNENDRVGEYLKILLDDYIFDELSDEYLKKADAESYLKGVPVPIKATDFLELTNVKIAHAMAVVLGCDINFKYGDNYIQYILKSFGKEFVKPLIREGVDYAVSGDTLRACVYFRGALQLDPENIDALYCYARACKDTYEKGEGESFVGMFKAEALACFEEMTLKAPDFPPGFYYLGYGYLNLGLYQKAMLTFKEYVDLIDKNRPEEASEIPPEVKEEQEIMYEDVREWIKRLKEPIVIEEGYNMVLSGRFVEGIETLLPFSDNPNYKDWWPLHYYLGISYKELDMFPEAEEELLKVLKLSPSDISTMEELLEIYELTGNEELSDKYREKILLVQRNLEEEKAQRNTNFS